MRFLILCAIGLLFACQTPTEPDTPKSTVTAASTAVDINPPAIGFNQAGSDPEAIALADSVMKAMGGRRAWDNTRAIRWNFFGRRTLTWDKRYNKVRIDFHDQNVIVSADTDGKKGWVVKDGIMIGNIKESVGWIKKANEIWVNDSYWVAMPFKLKDSGVTLSYIGKDSTKAGQAAEVIQLTFDGVGITPGNKYHVYIDPQSYLVTQWAFFAKADDSEPRFVLPWGDYKEYDGIMLASDRGEQDLTGIAVINDIGPEFFNDSSIPLDQ